MLHCLLDCSQNQCGRGRDHFHLCVYVKRCVNVCVSVLLATLGARASDATLLARLAEPVRESAGPLQPVFCMSKCYVGMR